MMGMASLIGLDQSVPEAVDRGSLALALGWLFLSARARIVPRPCA